MLEPEKLPAFHQFQQTDVGLEIKGSVPFEDYWEFFRKKLAPHVRIGKALPFWIGDFCNYGLHTYGDKYTQALDLSGYSYSYLRNLCYTCKNVPPENRVVGENVGINHHYQVARMPLGDQREILEKASAENLSVQETRDAVSRMLPHTPRTKVPSEWGDFYNVYIVDHNEASGRTYEKHMRAAWDAGFKAKGEGT